jgi:uracil-DNA glycosylase family 4
MRRQRYLEEMGLGPVWKLRRPGTASTGTDDGATAASAEAIVEARMAEQRSAFDSAPASGAEDRVARIQRMDWTELRAEVAGCTQCGLHKTRTQTVFGVGDQQADWLLVGEAPGSEEDARGEPFVGQAGRLLDNMLSAVSLTRGENVYICNVLKCRPPGNRNPEPAEVAQCRAHLLRQLELTRPKLVLALGRFAAQTLLETDASVGSLRGRVHAYQNVPLIITYHPAYLLRNLPDKAKAWEDLCFARRTMATL